MKVSNQKITMISGIATAMILSAVLLKKSDLIVKKKEEKKSFFSKIKTSANELKSKVVTLNEQLLNTGKAKLADMNSNA